MISKIGLIALALISCGLIYMLDYFLNQDKKDSAEQLHAFVQQTHQIGKDREKFEMQLMSDIASCQKEALMTHNMYVDLIHKVASNNEEHPYISSKIIGDAANILERQISKCKKTYESRLNEGK